MKKGLEINKAIKMAIYLTRLEANKGKKNISQQADIAFNALCRINEELTVFKDVLPKKFLELSSLYINEALDKIDSIGKKNPVVCDKLNVNTVLSFLGGENAEKNNTSKTIKDGVDNC